MPTQSNSARTVETSNPSSKKLAKREVAISLGQVDIEADDALAAEFNVSVAPTIILFRNGTEPAKYSGKNTVEGISNWIAQTSGFSQVRSAADLEKAVKGRAKDAILVAVKGSRQAGTYLAETAVDVSVDDGHTPIRYIYFELDGEFSLELHRGVHERIYFETTPDKEYYPADFVEFVQKEKLPLFGMMSPTNVQSLLNSEQKGIVGVCFAPQKLTVQAEKYASLFKKVAAKWKKYRVVYVDAGKGELPASAPQCDDHPSIVIIFKDPAQFGQPAREVRKTFQKEELTEKNVNSFLKAASTVEAAGSKKEL